MEIKTIVLLSIIFYGCYVKEKNASDKISIEQIKDYQGSMKDTSDSTFFATPAFLEKLYKKKNLVTFTSKNSFAYKKTTVQGNKYNVESTFSIGNHNFRYSLNSRKKIIEPALSYFDRADYLSSTIEIDNIEFSLDSLIVQPSELIKEKEIRLPFRLFNMGLHTYFSFLNKEYVIIEAYHPCNGRYCNEHYLLFFEIDHKKIKLIPIYINDYYPFTFENIFIGDWNDDKQLDIFCLFPLENNKTLLKIYTKKENLFVPLKNKNGLDYNIYFTSRVFFEEDIDSLIIYKNNIF